MILALFFCLQSPRCMELVIPRTEEEKSNLNHSDEASPTGASVSSSCFLTWVGGVGGLWCAEQTH